MHALLGALGRHSWISTGCALALLLLFLWTHFVVARSQFYRFSDEPVESFLHEVSIHLRTPDIVPEYSIDAIGEINIQYPYEMRIDRSGVVRLRYSVKATNGYRYALQYPYSVSATLKSQDFRLLEKETQSARASELPLQVYFEWHISPTRHGKWPLHFDLGDLQGDQFWPGEILLFVNGKEQIPTRWEQKVVKVTVLTEWGITRLQFEILDYGVLALACILGYPIVSKFIERIASRFLERILTPHLSRSESDRKE